MGEQPVLAGQTAMIHMPSIVLDLRALAAQIAQVLAAIGFFWLLGWLLLALFAWERRRRFIEPALLAGLTWLALLALGELLLALTPCLAPNAALALGLLGVVVLCFALPLRAWQRYSVLFLTAFAMATQAYAQGCAGPAALWIGLGSAAGAALALWLLGRWPAGLRLWQRFAINIDNRTTRLARTPVRADIQATLEAQLCRHLRLAVAHLQPLSADGAHTSTPLVVDGLTPAGEPQRFFVKIITQSNWQAALIHGITRWLQHRDQLKIGPLWLTLRSLAEHEHYMGLLFRDIGVPTPRVQGLYRLDPEVYALVSDFLEGARPLRSLGEVQAPFVTDGFLALRRMRAADYAHADIKASNIMVLPGERFAFVDLAAAMNNAGPRRQEQDLSDLLVALAMHHPPESVVAIARSVLGQKVLRRAVPYLHRSTLNVETQKIVPLDLPRTLRRLIALGGEPEEAPEAEEPICPIPPS